MIDSDWYQKVKSNSQDFYIQYFRRTEFWYFPSAFCPTRPGHLRRELPAFPVANRFWIGYMNTGVRPPNKNGKKFRWLDQTPTSRSLLFHVSSMPGPRSPPPLVLLVLHLAVAFDLPPGDFRATLLLLVSGMVNIHLWNSSFIMGTCGKLTWQWNMCRLKMDSVLKMRIVHYSLPCYTEVINNFKEDMAEICPLRVEDPTPYLAIFERVNTDLFEIYQHIVREGDWCKIRPALWDEFWSTHSWNTIWTDVFQDWVDQKLSAGPDDDVNL